MVEAEEQEASAASDPETPAEFLANLGTLLREKQGVDVGLANVLAKYLLTAVPTVDAVKKAKDAILKLAHERANLPMPEVDDG